MDSIPNHHAHHPGFSGLRGYLAALTMVAGRTRTAKLAAQLTSLNSDDRLVDVGCGPGAAARHAAQIGAGVTAVDPSSEMLRVARLTSSVGPGRKVDWRKGVAEHLPVDDASATVVWSLASVHHFPDLEGALAEALRVLAPGGRFLAIERRTRAHATGLASHGWTDEQAGAFAELCRPAGFAAVEMSVEWSTRPTVLAVRAIRAQARPTGEVTPAPTPKTTDRTANTP